MAMRSEIIEKFIVLFAYKECKTIILILTSSIIEFLLLSDLAFYINYIFNSLSIPMRLILSSPPFYSYRNWGSGCLNNWSKVSKLVEISGARIQIQVEVTPKPVF